MVVIETNLAVHERLEVIHPSGRILLELVRLRQETKDLVSIRVLDFLVEKLVARKRANKGQG